MSGEVESEGLSSPGCSWDVLTIFIILAMYLLCAMEVSATTMLLTTTTTTVITMVITMLTEATTDRSPWQL